MLKSLCILAILLMAAVYTTRALNLLSKPKLRYSFPKLEVLRFNPTVAQFNARIEPKGVDVNGVYGTLSLTKYADKNMKIVFKVLSGKSNSEFSAMKPTLLSFPQTNTFSFMDMMYKDFMMSYVKNCSNLPQFQGKWGERSMAGDYSFNNCPINSKTIANIFQVGYYCMLGKFTRTVEPKMDAEVRIYMKVEKE